MGLGKVAASGPEGFVWLAVLALIFVAPYMLMMAEIGSAFTMEGGPYEWVRLAFGRIHGGICAILYWVTNPLWVGGSLAFISTQCVHCQRASAVFEQLEQEYAGKLQVAEVAFDEGADQVTHSSLSPPSIAA